MAGLTVVKTQDGIWDNPIAWLKNLNDVRAGSREAFLEHLLTPFSPVQWSASPVFPRCRGLQSSTPQRDGSRHSDIWVYHMRGVVLSHIPSYLIPLTSLWYSNYSHFTDRETEAQRDSAVTCHSCTASKKWRQDSNSGLYCKVSRSDLKGILNKGGSIYLERFMKFTGTYFHGHFHPPCSVFTYLAHFQKN